MKLKIPIVILIIAISVGVGLALVIPDDTDTMIDDTDTTITESPCEEGYYLAGDTCDKMPPGYVETRNECEMGVDSREAAGVEQDYQLELEKCR